MNTPEICEVMAVPQLRGGGTLGLAIGLTLSDGHIAWGDCVGDDVPTAAQAEELLNQTVRIGLRGQPAASFRDLCGRWVRRTAVTETAEPLPPPAPPQVADPSRRQLLRGWQPEPAPPIQTRTVLVNAPLPASLAYGVSQACLRATAHAHGRTPLAQWRAEYELAEADPPTAVPLMGDVAQVEQSAVLRQMSAVAYTLPTGHAEQLIGAEGVRLQAYVRQLGEWLGQVTTHHPLIYVNVRGHMGTVYNHIATKMVGRLLGAISGLRSSCPPHALWLGDVVLGGKAAEVLPSLATFVKQRQLTQLVAREPLGTVSAVASWLASQHGHVCHLEVWRFGSLSAVGEALALCQQAAVPVILSGHVGETSDSAALLVDIALAAQPAFLHMGNPHLAYNWQVQRLAELNGR